MDSNERTRMGHPEAGFMRNGGFDANEPSRMGITCFLTFLNKRFLSLYLGQALHGNVFVGIEKPELLRPSEVRKRRER